LPFRWHEPKTSLDVSERRMPIEKFAERIPDPEKGSVIMRLTNVVFAVIARVIDAPIGKLHRAFVFAERVIVLLRLPIAEREIVKAEFDRFLAKENATHIHSFVERAASQIVHLMVVRLFLAELMDAKGSNVFFLNKVAMGGLLRLSACDRNSSGATGCLAFFGKNFVARSSLTPSFATACSCSSNGSRDWSLSEFFF